MRCDFRFWTRNDEHMRVIARTIADICNFFMNVPFYSSAEWRVKLSEVADFQWLLESRFGISSCDQSGHADFDRDTSNRNSQSGFELTQVFFCVHGCCAARSGRGHGLLVLAIGHVASHKHTRMPALDELRN